MYHGVDGRIVPRFEDEDYSRREIFIARQAFADGVCARPVLGDAWYGAEAEAAKRYPLPMVTRPRVVKDETGPAGTYYWRVDRGVLQHTTSLDAGMWEPLAIGMYITVPRVHLLAELLANPTETVEAEP